MKSQAKSTRAKRKVGNPRLVPKRKAAATQAIVQAKPEPWVLRAEQVALLKRTVAKGTTDDEFALFLWVAKKHKLDPMTRQLHCVKRWSRAANADVMAIQIGIDGYRSMAARYQDYGGIDEPEYEFAKAGDKIPTMARVKIWKKGFEHPTIGIAFWDEYAPDLSKPLAFMWKQMPRHMLAKVAEALALRKAYPDLADIYTDEEMAQADNSHAPSGRVLVSEQESTGSLEAAQAVGQRKIAEAAGRENETAIERIAPKATERQVTISRPPEHNGNFIILTGMIELPGLQQFFQVTDSKGFKTKQGQVPYRRVPSEYEKDLIRLCERLKIEVAG